MLGLRKVTQEVESTSFRCGNEGIERQIADSYYATLLREGYGYEITIQAENEPSIPVGYCMIKLVTLNKEHIPEEEQECYSQVYANRSLQHAAIEITYLAIDEKVQRNGVGASALKLIVNKIRLASRDVPIRYIVLDSLVGKMSFYKDKGFQPLGNRSEDGETQFMYLDCIEDRQLLDAYINNV